MIFTFKQQFLKHYNYLDGKLRLHFSLKSQFFILPVRHNDFFCIIQLEMINPKKI